MKVVLGENDPHGLNTMKGNLAKLRSNIMKVVLVENDSHAQLLIIIKGKYREALLIIINLTYT